jgi:translation initiation factor 4G
MSGSVGRGATSSDIEPQEHSTKVLVNKFRGYINKITDRKYDSIVRKIEGLEINTEDKLKGVLELIYVRAVDEPIYSHLYAKLCKHLCKLKVTKENRVTAEFRKLLIFRCQQEFEKNIYEDINLEGRMTEIISSGFSDDEKAILKTKLEDAKRKSRKRYLGNIKFIGELYRMNLVKGFILQIILRKLMMDINDESLESLCILLKIVGKQLETEMNSIPRTDLEQYFDTMRFIVITRPVNISTRVRFFLQDIIEMRDNDWQETRMYTGIDWLRIRVEIEPIA